LNKPSMFYPYMLIAVGLIVLGFSMYAMIQALTAYDSGDYAQFFFYGVMASAGTVLALSSITQMRRRMAVFHALATRVLSTVLCANCGFKVIRSFTPGDYVTKEVGQCQQCQGRMRVEVIYAEEAKSK